MYNSSNARYGQPVVQQGYVDAAPSVAPIHSPGSHHIGSKIKSVSYRDPHMAKAAPSNAAPTVLHFEELGTTPMDVAPIPGTAVNTSNTVTTTETRLVEDYHDRHKTKSKSKGLVAAPGVLGQPSTSTFSSGGVYQQPALVPGTTTTTTAATGHAPGWVDPNASQVYVIHEHRADGNPLVEAIATVAKGDMPHNLQTAQIIDKTLISLEAERLHDPYLNDRGKRIARHTEDLLVATKDFLYMKNSDEKLQQIIKEAGLAGTHAATGVSSSGISQNSELKNQANESLFLARGLFRDVLHSKDFRLLLIDTFDILQQVFGNKMASSGTQLKDVLTNKIKSGESVGSIARGVKNMVLGKGEFKTSTNPLTAAVGDNLTNATMSSRDVNLAQQQPQQFVQQPVLLTSQIRVISEDPNTRVEIIENPIEQQEWADRSVGFDQVPVVAATTTAATGTGFLSSLSEQQKREFAIKLRSLLIRYGERPEFKRAAKSMFRLVKLGSRSSSQIRTTGVRNNDNMHNLWIDLQDFIERFTGGKSVRPLIKNFKKLSFMMKNDANSVAWFRDFRKYAITTFEDPRTLEDDARVDAMMQLIDRGRVLYNSDQYRQYTTAITWESRELLERVRNDPNRKAISRALGKLSQDLLYDMKGNPSPMALQESLGQLRLLMVPVLLSQLQNVNLPRIEGYTPKIDYAISNVIFNGDDILPQHMRLTMENDIDINFRQLGTEFTRHKLILSIQNIRTQLDNIQFAYRKKTFPKLHDEGLVDVALSGAGTSILIEWKVESGGGVPLRFVCSKASCVIDNLLINIKQAHHSFLDRLATKLFKNTVRAKMEMAIADKLLDFGQSMSDKLNLAVRNRELKSQKVRGYGTSAYASSSTGYGVQSYAPAVTAKPKHDLHTTTVTQTTLRSV